jgi:hypothetical protein
VFSGSSDHELEVTVAMRRLAIETFDAPALLGRQRAQQQQ